MSELAAPFPYFGGKRRAASLVWSALGDPSGYVEPFCGSAAALLARPPFKGRRVETINDSDGWLINTWRAIQLSPEKVAEHAFGPVAEVDYHARLAWLQERRGPELIRLLEGDPEWHDAKAAAWWLHVAACGIGDPWGGGPWRVIDGELVDSRQQRWAGNPSLNESVGVNRKLPHLGNAGRGIHRALPHLGDAGKADSPLTAYMSALARRLERVRITCGSWERVLKPSVVRAKSGGDGSIGILLDPPYATSSDLYAGGRDGEGVAHETRLWCLDADPDLRIVLCGYDNEHDALLSHDWSVIEGKSGGGAGYSTRRDNGRRERLWLSPACLDGRQLDIFQVTT